ncbi:MAG: DUF6089 family protein [Daejeonella sp.]
MRRILLIFFCFSSLLKVSGQTWEIGGGVGGSGYMGDINPIKPYLINNLAFVGQIKRNFDGYWSLKLNFMQGRIQADDRDSPNVYQQQRNLNFYSSLTEISAQTEFNFFKFLPGDIYAVGNKRFSPYLFTGVGGVYFNPKNNEGTELQPLKTENQGSPYLKYAISVPYGTGIKYNIKGKLNLVGEIGYRTAFTDYLDDVSSRGDFLYNAKRDTYMFAGISLTYTFVSQKCPTF